MISDTKVALLLYVVLSVIGAVACTVFPKARTVNFASSIDETQKCPPCSCPAKPLTTP